MYCLYVRHDKYTGEAPAPVGIQHRLNEQLDISESEQSSGRHYDSQGRVIVGYDSLSDDSSFRARSDYDSSDGEDEWRKQSELKREWNAKQKVLSTTCFYFLVLLSLDFGIQKAKSQEYRYNLLNDPP